MKKVLYAVICCVVMVYGIVPMNVGNKWWYKFEEEKNSLPKVYEKHIYTVGKDTTVQGINKKIINVCKYDYNSFISTNNELWYDDDNLAKRNYSLIYKNNQSDSSWSTLGAHDYYSLVNNHLVIWGGNYSSQKIVNSGYTGGTSSIYNYFNYTITAKDLGIIEISSSYSTYYNSGYAKSIPCAAQIDGVFMGDTTNVFTTICDNIKDITNLLASNYPNPFNNSTVINYTLPQKCMTRLDILNNKGELVKTLNSAMQEAGSHQVTFNATGLNSGIYFYRLSSNGRETVNKMLLVK